MQLTSARLDPLPIDLIPVSFVAKANTGVGMVAMCAAPAPSTSSPNQAGIGQGDPEQLEFK